jgi:2-polyprenyl-3-methyl-5-hydroxy-6-metoxy-1,4-benzoquinol methylase
MEANSPACKVCGGKTVRLSVPPPVDLDLSSCTRCRLVFVSTPISEEETLRVYNDVNDSYHAERESTINLKALKALHALQPILSREGRSLLDVGCGFGNFLEIVKTHSPSTHVFGHELPGKSSSVCRKKGLVVYDCRLENIRQKFDVITLLDVAEHLADPCAVFKACAGLLADGGFIYLHTPRMCAWDTIFFAMQRISILRKLSTAWLNSRLSIYHQQLWSDLALKLALEKSGFTVVHLRPMLEFSAPVEAHLKSLSRDLRVQRISEPFARAVPFLASLIIQLKLVRNKAECLARKPISRERAG